MSTCVREGCDAPAAVWSTCMEHFTEWVSASPRRSAMIPDPIHDTCGRPYVPGHLSTHLQSDCPSPPTEADLIAFIDRILAKRRG